MDNYELPFTTHAEFPINQAAWTFCAIGFLINKGLITQSVAGSLAEEFNYLVGLGAPRFRAMTQAECSSMETRMRVAINQRKR